MSMPLLEVGLWMIPIAVIVLFAVLLMSCTKRPTSPFRLALRIRYSPHISGQEHFPRTGPALLVCTPGHYYDWLPLLLLSRRTIHMVVPDGWALRPKEQSYLHSIGAISLPRFSEQSELDEVIEKIQALLNRGEIVCLFPFQLEDAQCTFSFADLFAKVRITRAPVHPVSLHYPYGSPYRSVQNSFELRERPSFRCPVWMACGPALEEECTPAEIIQAVQHLSSNLAIEKSDSLLPVHREMVRQAARHPFRLCLIDGTTRAKPLSYGRTLAGAMCLASYLQRRIPDERMIGIWLPSGAGGALTNIALALLGKVSVNLNYTSSQTGVQSSITQCNIKTVITAKRFVERMPLDPGPGVSLIYLEDILLTISTIQKTIAFLKVLLIPGALLDKWVLGLRRHTAKDLATIIFSSGSTGDPKGVMLTHGNIRANGMSLISVSGAESRDRILGVLPFFHSFGYTVTLWVPLQLGAAVVYYADPRQAREIGQLSKQHQCTIYLSTATFLRFCLKKCNPEDFRTVRYLFCGAEKLPPALAEDFERKFGCRPLEGYGCTELTPVTSINLPDITHEDRIVRRNRIGSIGPPLHGVSARVVDVETHEPLPLGQEGLLVIGGPNVMAGYLDRPDLTEKVLLNGAYITGDMARIEADGYITLTGRLSRFAKIGGEMVPLEGVEEALHQILATADRVLAVTAVPDPRRGERIIVLYLSEGDVRPGKLCAQLSDRAFPNLWIPSEADFHAVDELPYLGSGKLDLRELHRLAVSIHSLKISS